MHQRARIAGDLDCTGAAFDAAGDLGWDETPALLLERVQVGGTLLLCELQAPLTGATLAIGETQLYDPLAFASVRVRCIDRNFLSNVGVHGKYSLEPLQ